MSDYSEFNSQYEQKFNKTDTAYKIKKQNKKGVSIRTAKTKTKIFKNDII